MAANAYVNLVNGVLTMVRATQTSSGVANANQIPALTANGVLDISLMPNGLGPDTATVIASEALAAGALVNIWSNAGVFNVRNADNSTSGKEAHGFVLSAVSSSGAATVYFNGTNNAVTGLTPGVLYLSTVGSTTSTAPTTAGNVLQRVGEATSATSMNFTTQPPVILA